MLIFNIRLSSRVLRLAAALFFSLVLLIGLLLAMIVAHPPDEVMAQGSTLRYVAPAPTGDDISNNCTARSLPVRLTFTAIRISWIPKTGITTSPRDQQRLIEE